MCFFFYFETVDGEVSTKPNLALALALAQTKPHRPSDPPVFAFAFCICFALVPLNMPTCTVMSQGRTNLFWPYCTPMLVCHLKSGPALSSAMYVRTTHKKICLIHALGNPALGASPFANSDFPPIG